MIENFKVNGMSCAACQNSVTRAVKKLSGVINVDVNLLSGAMKVEFDEQKITTNDIVSAVKKAGYDAELKDNKNKYQNHQSHNVFAVNSLKTEWNMEKLTKNAELKTMIIRVVASFVFLIPLLWVTMGSMIELAIPPFLSGQENSLTNALFQLVLTTIIVFINRKFFITGTKALISRSPNMDSLVMLGSGAAYLYSLVLTFISASVLGAGDSNLSYSYTHSLYFETCATILTLVTLGKFFESLSKKRTTNALDKLISLAPKTVCVIKDETETVVNFDELKKGDLILIRAGDVVPADGEIIEGEGVFDVSAVTGESMPIEKTIGDKVISASVCKDGVLKIRAESVGEDSTLTQIIKLVEEAGNSKAPISRIADRVSAIFVPVVISISVVTFVIWMVATHNLAQSLKSAISVLVISCPCALGLATPVAIMISMGKSASFGVLIKSAEALETLSKAKTIVFDKTGTITKGSPAVTDVLLISDDSYENIFSELATLERGNTHPLARAIQTKAEVENLKTKDIKFTKYSSVSGGGVVAEFNKETWIAGSLKFIENTAKIKLKKNTLKKIETLKNEGKTIVIFAKNNEIKCVLGISDEIKTSSQQAIEKLNKMGIKTILLSGDNRVVAEAVGKQVCVSEVYAEILPQNKEKIVSQFKNYGVTVMVGDGINDSPALASADVGISVSSGSDIARETADIILTNNSLDGVCTAIQLSRATMRNIKVNLFWAFFYNTIGIPLAAGVFYPLLGWQLSPMIGALAMSLSSVCVVLNSLTLNLFKPKNLESKSKRSKSLSVKNNKDKTNFNEIENNTSTTSKTGNENEKQLEILHKKIKTSNEIKIKIEKEKIMKKQIKIEGMSCSHCTARVGEILKQIKGITNVSVSLENAQAEIEITKNISDKVIKSAIEKQGYKVTAITNL